MRKLMLPLTALLLVSCQPAPPAPDPAAGVARAEAVARGYFDTFNRHDWETLAAMYAPEAEFKDPSLGAGTVRQTRAQFVEKYTGLAQAFPDVRDSIVAVYPSGEHVVVVEFVSRGSAPDGSKFELPICTIFTLVDSLITRDFTYYDNF